MILVTGCNGLAGQAFVKELASLGMKTRALMRDGAPIPGADVVKGEIRQLNTLESALKGMQVLIAAANGPKEHEAQPLLLDAARRAKIKYVIKWSITGALKESPVGLGRRHALGEEQLKKSGLPFTIMRAHLPMQFFLYAKEAMKSGVLTSATQDKKFAMLDSRDLAKLVQYWLEEPADHVGRTHFVTGEALSSYSDMLDAIGEVTKRKIRHENVSPQALQQELVAQKFAPWIVEDIPLTHQALVMRADMQKTTLKDAGITARTVRDFAKDYAGAFA